MDRNPHPPTTGNGDAIVQMQRLALAVLRATTEHALEAVRQREGNSADPHFGFGNPLVGCVEVDESYLGGRDPSDKRDCNLAGKSASAL